MIRYDTNSNQFDFDSDISINNIKEYFKQHNSGPFFSMFETGLGGLRFDLIRIDPYRQYVRIFEFKSGRADLVSDKKWQNYLKYCHTLTFVCPRETIQKDDLPSGIGLMWIYKWKHKSTPWSKNWTVEAEWIKKPKAKDIDTETLLRLVFMLLHHVRWRSNDIF